MADVFIKHSRRLGPSAGTKDETAFYPLEGASVWFDFRDNGRCWRISVVYR